MTSALLLNSQPFTVVSATNINSITPKEWFLKDKIGMTVLTTGAPVIVIDRGSSSTFDTIAFINTTLTGSASLRIETSTVSNFASLVHDTGVVALPIQSINAMRKCVSVHTLPSSTARYIRLTFSGVSSFELARIAIGKAFTTDGIRTNANRTFDDRSEIYEVGAFSDVDERPTLLGWSVEFPHFTDDVFRTVAQPFLQDVGLSKPFLFIPKFDQTSTWQSDWCYGRIMTRVEVPHQAHDHWLVKITMRSIYP